MIVSVCVITIVAVIGLALLAGGIFCLVRYAQTRQILFLILGVLFTFIIPGVMCCLALALWVPSTMVVYGPPPPTLRP